MTFIHNLDPVILNLGFLEIRWYGLMYVIGFLIVYFFLKHKIKTKQFEITEKKLDNLLFILIIAMLIGSRLFAVFVYHPVYYLAHPLEIVMFWKGGLSFHGALLGMIIAGIIWCKKNKFSFFKLADFMVIPVSLAQFFGRIGNFINGELYGKITSLPWAVKFQGVVGFRHPTQIYEALYNLVIFFVLLFYSKKNPKKGRVFGLFLILYCIFRFSIEFLKDMELFGPLTMGQWLSIPMLFFGFWLMFRKINQ